MPLVQPAPTTPDAELSALITLYEETLGFCPNSVLTMSHRPEIAKAFVALNKAVMENHGRVTSSLKRLIGYISSHAAGCRYCQAHTIRAAERYGAETDQLENIWLFDTHSAFSAAERSALNFARAASLIPNAVDDAIADELRAHWSEGEIVEIAGVVALFGYLNRWNDSIGTTIETPAIESGRKWLNSDGWTSGKHG
jgi:uncharacterized peroxidase-related enzyme